MSETRKLAAILVADVVGYSRLAGADEERTLARLRALRSDLIDPAIAVHHGRIVKRTGDGLIVEFRSVVDAVRCAIEVQNGMVAQNAALTPDQRIEFRVGVHVGDVVEEEDGDLMGDGVNIAARLEGVAKPGGICLSEDAWRQVQGKIDASFADLGAMQLKNIARPVRAYSPLASKAASAKRAALIQFRRRGAAIAAALVLILAIGAGWYLAIGSKLIAPNALHSGAETPEKPIASETLKAMGDQYSIVVLPFVNLSGDASQDYFVDGITESLTTDLRRSPGPTRPST
jgi:adenylate cyclase